MHCTKRKTFQYRIPLRLTNRSIEILKREIYFLVPEKTSLITDRKPLLAVMDDKGSVARNGVESFLVGL